MGSKEVWIKILDTYIKVNEGDYSEWYVGITEHVNVRRKEHKAEDALHKHLEASSDEVAREIEKHFLDLGCDGGPGGGDSGARTVYVYKKSEHTEP